MMRADFAKLNETLQLEPGEEAAHGDAIGGARIRVADMGGEEIDEAQRGPLAGAGDHRRHGHPGGRLDDGERGRRCQAVAAPDNYAVTPR
jgi:hypothetical protein